MSEVGKQHANSEVIESRIDDKTKGVLSSFASFCSIEELQAKEAVKKL